MSKLAVAAVFVIICALAAPMATAAPPAWMGGKSAYKVAHDGRAAIAWTGGFRASWAWRLDVGGGTKAATADRGFVAAWPLSSKRSLVAGSQGLELVKLPSWKRVKRAKGYGWVHAVSADGRRVVATVTHYRGPARVLDARTLKPKGPPMAVLGELNDAAFTPSGRVILASSPTPSGPRRLTLVSARGKVLSAFAIQGSTVSALGEDRAVVGGRGGARIHELGTGKVVATLASGGTRPVITDPTGRLAVVSGAAYAKHLDVYDRDGRSLGRIAHGPPKEKASVIVRPLRLAVWSSRGVRFTPLARWAEASGKGGALALPPARVADKRPAAADPAKAKGPSKAKPSKKQSKAQYCKTAKRLMAAAKSQFDSLKGPSRKRYLPGLKKDIVVWEATLNMDGATRSEIGYFDLPTRDSWRLEYRWPFTADLAAVQGAMEGHIKRLTRCLGLKRKDVGKKGRVVWLHAKKDKPGIFGPKQAHISLRAANQLLAKGRTWIPWASPLSPGSGTRYYLTVSVVLPVP